MIFGGGADRADHESAKWPSPQERPRSRHQGAHRPERMLDRSHGAGPKAARWRQRRQSQPLFAQQRTRQADQDHLADRECAGRSHHAMAGLERSVGRVRWSPSARPPRAWCRPIRPMKRRRAPPNFSMSPIKSVPLTADYRHDMKAMLAANPNAGLYYVVNPNNPTGTMTPIAEIEWLVDNKPAGSVVVIDEAYIHLTTRLSQQHRQPSGGGGQGCADHAHLLQDLRHGRHAGRLSSWAAPIFWQSSSCMMAATCRT